MANLEHECPDEKDDDLVMDDVEDPFSASTQQWMNMLSPNSYANKLSEISKFLGQIRLKKEIGIKDIVKEHVLAFLPAKSLSRFKTVSKEWDQWINSPFFAHTQATQFRDVSGLFRQFPGESPSFISLDPTAFGIPDASLSFLPEPVDIRTTCNGLLCCQSCYGDQAYYVCNPATREWRKLPMSSYYHGPGTAIALAFEPSILNFAANYELICAVPLPHIDIPVLYFEIYSSRSNSWRTSETLCFELDALGLNGDGFYTRGFAYWETQRGAVLVFDLKYETYGMLSLPSCSGPTGALTEMHGNLCYLMPQKEEFTIEVYGDLNMSLKHVIPLSSQAAEYRHGLCRALSMVNNDTLILDFDGKIVAYHSRSQKLQCLMNARNEGFEKYLPYVNNLANLPDPKAIE